MVKICVPITGCDMEEIKEQLEELSQLDFDMIEWRVDYFYSLEAFKMIKKSFPDKEIIFTFRTLREGGQKQPTDDELVSLYTEAAMTGMADYIDIELEGLCYNNSEIINKLKSLGVKIVISNHDFEKTPNKGELIDKFIKMEKIGADIGKIAVMPIKKEDIENLMDASREASKIVKIKLVAISMGQLGTNTRLRGAEFGSSITFGALNKASAPGQIPAKQLREKLKKYDGMNILSKV